MVVKHCWIGSKLGHQLIKTENIMAHVCQVQLSVSTHLHICGFQVEASPLCVTSGYILPNNKTILEKISVF
jgi:hypothetical protein